MPDQSPTRAANAADLDSVKAQNDLLSQQLKLATESQSELNARFEDAVKELNERPENAQDPQALQKLQMLMQQQQQVMEIRSNIMNALIDSMKKMIEKIQ